MGTLISAWLSTKSQSALASTSHKRTFLKMLLISVVCKKSRWPATVGAIPGGRADEGYTRLGSFKVLIGQLVAYPVCVCRNTVSFIVSARWVVLHFLKNVWNNELSTNCIELQLWLIVYFCCWLRYTTVAVRPLDVMLHYMHCQAREESRRRRRWVCETSTQYNSRPKRFYLQRIK